MPRPPRPFIAALIVLSALLLQARAIAQPDAAPARRITVSLAFDRDRLGAAHQAGATIDDPVRIASISKLLTALGVMRLVEQGRLGLDADVSAHLGFAVRHPRFPDRPVTLRLLLSHRAGLVDGIDYALPLGHSLRDALADPAAWNPDHGPGDWFGYANLNFPVIAGVMEAATGERFDRLMARLVFAPLGIMACFNWTTCPDEAVARAVPLIGADGRGRADQLGGRRPDCPVRRDPGTPCALEHYRPGSNGALFSPQGGARISAAGLARIGQMLLRGGESFLSPASIATLTAPVWTHPPDPGDGGDEHGGSAGLFCRYGLAVHWLESGLPGCADALFGDGRPRFGHAGEAYGLRSGLWLDPAAGTGIVYFITAVPDDAPPGQSAFSAIEEAVARGR